MNQSDLQDKKNSPMEYSLTKHLFFDRLLLVLPIESNLKTYADVEADSVFNSCRSIILNIAITKDLNPIIENTLGLIDLIVQDEKSRLTILQMILPILYWFFWDYWVMFLSITGIKTMTSRKLETIITNRDFQVTGQTSIHLGQSTRESIQLWRRCYYVKFLSWSSIQEL